MLEQLRILLVEDHPFQLLATQCLLRNYGYHDLALAENAEQAMRLMTQTDVPFDILLCDQCLPDLPGLELIEIANRRGFIRSAILLSGLPVNELEHLMAQASRRNFALLGYLSKPLSHLELNELIRQSRLTRSTEK
ncbi:MULTISPECIES: response regulator [unclassified Pseudomonas]|uniref:response regulator n=1 Tax=unclassified Pseudomonas TaxID=196821 RepID=UPI000B400579|nr:MULTISPECIES: response regulator [unclassified Pseudomonas]MDQ0666866.1 CheY-like chemotaxis protein [Pseudomonas sp. W2I6]PMU16851.1 response regulator [Pseudomonas sp. GP01-A9]PMU23972.1 response regulator [Pseudomonas sp. GP01-A13]PMU33762.1 response regulator [Pseudomonas sp. GP01-A8]PMU48725.1 response regulator [Pseudomonas sp. GP01-A6]